MRKELSWKRWITYGFIGSGSFFLLYFLYLSIAYGFLNISFSWAFLLMGGVLFTIGIIEYLSKQNLVQLLPCFLRRLCYVILIIGMTIFLILQGSFLYTGSHVSKKQANYAIVLGAQLNGHTISRLLRYRLDAAVNFAQTYPSAFLIVSGGQGKGENMSEAAAMKDYLLKHGVDQNRILMEDTSRNTQENFRNSKVLIKSTKDPQVSIITNSFHMQRSSLICRQQTLTCAAYPAKTDVDLAPVFYFREFFAYIKDAFLPT